MVDIIGRPIARYLVMAALCNRAHHYIFVLWFLLSSSFISSPNLSGRRLDVYHTSTHGVAGGPSAILECRSEMCCTRLAGNAGPKKSPKIRHLGSIAQLCRAMSSQLRHISTIGKSSNISYRRPPQYGELPLTSG